jgi:hypothetical protein
MGRLLLRGGWSRQLCVHTIPRNPTITISKINDPLKTFAFALNADNRGGK